MYRLIVNADLNTETRGGGFQAEEQQRCRRHESACFDLVCFIVKITCKVDPANYSADYVEFIFQDQYLGRSDMWRLGEHLVGQCVYTDQDVAFVGGIAAKIQTIYVDGKKVWILCQTGRAEC